MSDSGPTDTGSSSGAGKKSGKRRASDERQASQVEYQFLNFSHPSEAKASRARKTVRSHVTKQQHQKEQFAAQKAAERRTKSLPQNPQGQSELSLNQQRQHASSFPLSLPIKTEFPPIQTLQTSGLQTSGSETSSVRSTPISPSPWSPLPSPSARLDPLELYPQEWHSSVPRMIDHCMFDRLTCLTCLFSFPPDILPTFILFQMIYPLSYSLSLPILTSQY